MAHKGNDFLFDFILQSSKGRLFDFCVEVGCDDLYLLKKLAKCSVNVLGIDSQWKEVQPEIASDNFRVIGNLVENLNFQDVFDGRPDLIVLSHTLEHLADPRKTLQILLNSARDGALIAIEVPSFDQQIYRWRMDMVFHQHLHYFSLYSIVKLLESLGAEYVNHCINPHYLCGTMLIIFKKNPVSFVSGIGRLISHKSVATSISCFRQSLDLTMMEISRLDEKKYAYGASQLLPLLAYHLNTDMTEFAAVLDRSEGRIGKYFPGLNVPIIHPNNAKDISKSAVLITAIDSTRDIMPNLIALNPKTILRGVFSIN
jgi:cyclopropane-fatty-acyl-phospholipid synthase